jgi:hypothetical protein
MVPEIVIHDLSKDEIDRINPLIDNSSYKPYRYLNKKTEKAICQFWINRIATLMSGSDRTRVFIAEVNNRIEGFVVISHLPWDSDFFKIPMATVSDFVVNEHSPYKREIALNLLKHAIGSAEKAGYGFISCKTYSNDFVNIHALEKSDFLLVDSHLDFVNDFKKNPFHQVPEKKLPADVSVRFAQSDDEKELVSLAKLSFQNFLGRFHTDPRFSREQATQVYMEWMISGLKDKANTFIIAEIEGRIAGVSVWKQATDAETVIPVILSHYTIGAIHPDFFGRKIFQLLTYEGMRWLNGKADIIDGPTNINNFPVQQGYKRLGWQVVDAHHSFHLWLDSGTST